MQRWNHQLRGVSEVLAAFERGVRRVCLSSPTGGGKSLMMKDVVRAIISRGNRAALYTNRRLLLNQLSDGMVDDRISHGVRAAGHEADHGESFQVCSIQTEVSRSLKRGQWELHACRPGDLAIFDEGHLHTNGKALEIRAKHLAGGACTLDVTATPIGMGEVCDELIQAGTMSELRECGALVLANHFAPDEPDMRLLKSLKSPPVEGENFSEKQQKALMGAATKDGRANDRLHLLYGRVWANFEVLNPECKPTILFAPGVNESIWFATRFTEKGVRAAHIDGDHIWLDGELQPKTDELWEEVLNGSRTGRVIVLCNRFVLREGIDCPWLAHCVFATVFGSVQSYLQSGGRLLRAYPGTEAVSVQDHGGNWWRHGSLNIDRIWSLQDTAQSVYAKRADRLRERREREPVVCPQCSRVMTRDVCLCGYQFQAGKTSRPVLTIAGELKPVSGPIFAPRRISQEPTDIGRWVTMVYRASSRKWHATFRQAEAMFCRENYGRWPDRTWPLMPINPDDLYRHVSDVPIEGLRGSPEALAKLRAFREKQKAKQLQET